MQSNAVLQFESWSREESSFRAASINADRERKHIEESLHQLRLKHKQLSGEARESADLLGRFHRDCDLLEQEKERLSHQLTEERKLLEQCSHDTDELILQATSAKTMYHQKINSVQMELTDLLGQQEVQFVNTMICTKTVVALRDFLAELDHASKHETLHEFMNTLKNWIEIATSLDNSIADVDRLTKTVSSLRQSAIDIIKGESTNVRNSMKRYNSSCELMTMNLQRFVD